MPVNFFQAGPRPALSSAFQLQPGVDRLCIEPTGRLAAAQDALSAVRFERTENRAESRCPEHKRSLQRPDVTRWAAMDARLMRCF